MVKEIVWNKRAINDLNNIIKYLQSEWGDNVASNFVNRLYQLIDLIAEYPEMGTIEVLEKGIRGFVVTKHNTLFYRIENKRIILLNVFDNRQDPKKKKLIP